MRLLIPMHIKHTIPYHIIIYHIINVAQYTSGKSEKDCTDVYCVTLIGLQAHRDAFIQNIILYHTILHHIITYLPYHTVPYRTIP